MLSPPVFSPLTRCQGFVQPLRSGVTEGEGLCHAGSLHEAEIPRAARAVSATSKGKAVPPPSWREEAGHRLSLCCLCLSRSAQIPSLHGVLEMEFCCFPIQSHPLLAKLSKSRQLGRSPSLQFLLLVFLALAVTTDTVGRGNREQAAGCTLFQLFLQMGGEGLCTLSEPGDFWKTNLNHAVKM